MVTAKKSNTDKVIEGIEKMTVLELVDLVKQLEEKFGVSAAAPVMAQAVTPASAEAGAAPAQAVEEKTEFDVILAGVGDKKIQVIKVVRALTGLGLKEAKEVVDTAPKPVKEAVPKEEAEEAKAQLEEVGATVEIK